MNSKSECECECKCGMVGDGHVCMLAPLFLLSFGKAANALSRYRSLGADSWLVDRGFVIFRLYLPYTVAA